MFIVEMVILFFIFMGVILLVQGTRRIPVQYAKRIVGNKQYGGVRQYIPLKVNSAGVMPIIFAQALMFIPLTLSSFAPTEAMTGFAAAFSNFTGFWYNFTFAVLIILFTYFYTAVTINPGQMAEDMKRNGGFIPGVKPGREQLSFLIPLCQGSPFRDQCSLPWLPFCRPLQCLPESTPSLPSFMAALHC
jgi:preprotein translocase subunit SecY